MRGFYRRTENSGVEIFSSCMTAFDSLPDTKLTRDQENKLAEKIQAHQRPEDITSLVMANMREAVVYTRKVCNAFIHDDELISICYEALCKNAKRFKPNWQRFLAFAKAGLRGEVTGHIRKMDVVKHGKMISRELLKSELISGRPYVPRDDGDAPEVCLEAHTQEISEPEFDAIVTRERWAQLEPVIAECLTQHEQMMINLVYKVGYNFKEAGNLMGVSRAAMQGSHAKALRKIRCALLKKRQLFE